MSVTLEMFAQNIINVNNQATGVTTQYTTLQAAVTAAANGDIIYLYPSPISYGNATINKGLTIIGPGYLVAQNPSLMINTYVSNGFVDDITFAAGSDGTLITGVDFNYMTLNGQSNIAITRCKVRNRIYMTTTNNIFIEGCYFENQEGNGSSIDFNFFHLAANYNNNSLVVKNNLFFANNTKTRLIGISTTFSFDNIYIGPTSNAIVENNIFRDFVCFHNSIVQNNIFFSVSNNYNLSSGIYTSYEPIFLSGSSNLFQNNILVANQTGLGTTNISNVPEANIFQGWPTQGGNTFDDRFKLKNGSPAIGAGIGGIDCGAFGGGTPYKLSGIPFIPLVYQINAPTSGGPASGISVNVKIKTNN